MGRSSAQAHASARVRVRIKAKSLATSALGALVAAGRPSVALGLGD